MRRAHKFLFPIDVIYSKHSTLHCWKVQIIIIIIMWPVRFAHSHKHRISQKCHCTYNYNAFAYTLRFSFVDFSFIISFLFSVYYTYVYLFQYLASVICALWHICANANARAHGIRHPYLLAKWLPTRSKSNK